MKRNHLSGLENRIALLVVLASLWVFTGCGGEKPKPPGRPTFPVTVALVEQKSMPVQITAIGNVEPYSTVGVKTQVTGQLTGVFFKQGDFVKKGQLIFTLDKRQIQADIKRAEGQLARDLASLENAKAQAARYTALYKEGVISKEQADLQQTNAETFAAAVEADKAAVESAKVQLTYTDIYSPIEGRTGDLIVHKGNIVKANDSFPLVVIDQIEPVYVTFTVPEKLLPEIKRYNAKGQLAVVAKITGDPKPALGKLSFIDNAVDTATGTIKLKGEFANADHRLWPGSFADVSLNLTVEPNALVIPTAALQHGQQGPYVFVVKADKSVELRNVDVDRSSDKETVIRSGLQPGETVVTDGQARLAPGAQVEVSGGPASVAAQPTSSAGSGL
jgi:multidrug efflux system membrane fusion protein